MNADTQQWLLCNTNPGALPAASHNNGNTELQVSLFRPPGSVSSWNSGCGREYFTRPGQALSSLISVTHSFPTPRLPAPKPSSCIKSLPMRCIPSVVFIILSDSLYFRLLYSETYSTCLKGPYCYFTGYPTWKHFYCLSFVTGLFQSILCFQIKLFHLTHEPYYKAHIWLKLPGG